MRGQQPGNGLPVFVRRQAATGHVQGRGQHHQPYRFGIQQHVEPFRIQAAIGLHGQFNHPHAGGLKQTQDRPVARRFDHHGGVFQAQHGDQDFQYTAQVGADVDIIGVPVTHGRRGVAGSQGGAQFELATGLRRRLRLAGILAQQLPLQQQQRTVERLQQRRFIGAQDQHPRTPGIDVDRFQQIAAAVLQVD
ncbi:hypothetical protein D3C86_1009870 [compost metagenome]